MMATLPLRSGHSIRFIRALGVLGLLWASGTFSLRAQSSSDLCNLNLAHQYAVNTTCVPHAFNKPGTYTFNYNPGGCNASNNEDAFGWFTATSALTTVQFTPNNGDAILHVLAACGGISLGCSDGAGGGGAETVTIPTTPGLNYIVRVQRYNGDGSFNGNLCIRATNCLYRLNLYDTYGDGWGTYAGPALVEIFVNGVSLGLYTLGTGFGGYVDFGVNDGDDVQVYYYPNGAVFPEENYFDLTVAGQCLYSTDNPPNVALPYAVTADCTPSTAALAQDCVGGATICGNGNIQSNSTHTGCAVDLNPSNTGCLLGEENQGTWFYFSPSASGTVGFTLVPQNSTDDYDFALWGPYSAAQCPAGPPLRCSYFDGTYYNYTTTGMGNGATEASEGAYHPAPPALPPFTLTDPNADGWVSTLNVTAGQVYVLYIDNYSTSGQDFTLTWNLTNGASLDCATLPVELLSLKATPHHDVIDVTWATATEQNSDFFDVQRSADSEHFTTIGTVDAAGDAQFRSDYLYTDQQPLHGANYYRLKQVDRDGAYAYSQTVVAFMGLGGGKPVIFPNPATDVLNVAFRSPLDGEAVISVQDALGRTIGQRAVQAVRGASTVTLPTYGLARGWYNVRIDLPDGASLRSEGFIIER